MSKYHLILTPYLTPFYTKEAVGHALQHSLNLFFFDPYLEPLWYASKNPLLITDGLSRRIFQPNVPQDKNMIKA